MTLPSATLHLGLGLLVGALFVVSLVTGPAGIAPVDGLGALVVDDGATSLVMREIRLPRALIGVMVGAALGLAGAALQGYLRNPLADPGVLGIGASAGFGAVVALYTGAALAFPLALPLFALAAAAVGVLLMTALAGGGANTVALVLAGVAVSSLASAATALALNLSPNPFAVSEIVFWMLGSIEDRSMSHVAIAAPFLLAGMVALLALGRSLDALSLGADTAASLGVDLGRVRALVVVGTAAAVGAATAVAGSVAFVGLVVPHLLRPLVGARPSRLLPAAALGGAAMVTAADILVRVVLPEKDLKLGVVTAFVGAPFFLALVRRAAGGFR